MSSTARTLAVLEAFESAKQPLQLRELAARCGMPASTCHTVVRDLLARGYMYSFGRAKTLYPTRRFLALGQTYAAHDPYLRRVTEALEAVRDDTGETVILAKRQDDAVLYLHVLEGPRPIRYSPKAGDQRELHATAVGRALLSAMPDEALAQWLKDRQFTRITPATQTNPAVLAREVKEGRERGYFVARGENQEGLTAIAVAAPVEGEPLGIVVAGPTERMEAVLQPAAARLLRLKEDLARPR